MAVTNQHFSWENAQKIVMFNRYVSHYQRLEKEPVTTRPPSPMFVFPNLMVSTIESPESTLVIQFPTLPWNESITAAAISDTRCSEQNRQNCSEQDCRCDLTIGIKSSNPNSPPEILARIGDPSGIEGREIGGVKNLAVLTG